MSKWIMEIEVENQSHRISIERRKILADIYRLILNFSEEIPNKIPVSGNNKTTGTEHFGEDTGPAEKTTANDAGAF